MAVVRFLLVVSFFGARFPKGERVSPIAENAKKCVIYVRVRRTSLMYMP